jgi:signal transduction histidine kinase
VVAAAIALAGVGLVRAVEDQLLDGIRAASSARVGDVVVQLNEGVPPDELMLTAAPSADVGFVQVIDSTNHVLAGAPAPGLGRVFFVQSLPLGAAGGMTVDAAHAPAEVPLDVRYETVATAAGPVTVVAASPLDGVERSVATLKRTLLIGFPLLVALVALVAWSVVGRALRPVEAICAEVDSISARSLHRRVPEPQSGDEIQRLAQTMNAMLDRLEDASAREQQFVSDSSHELRSPVTSIRTQLEVAVRDPSPDWAAVAAGVLAEEARLESLIDDLLVLASIDEREASPPDPDREPVDIRALVASQAARIRAHPVDVVDHAVREPVLVPGDRQRLDRALANLLDNAARYAVQRVSLLIAREAGHVTVAVDDDGPGIPVEDRDRVFERFTRLSPGRARTDGGAGLGLAVVKAVVEGHRGRVTATASPLGGARLELTLPAAPPG